jgi:FMN-dependent NADH-azoreductase
MTALAVSEARIAELEATDVLVIATPMHNFTVPANLKSWIDHVVRLGRTFQSTPDGKVGRLRDRPTFVVVSSGGWFTPPRARQPDFLTAYLVSILATLGIRDVTLFPLEGLNRGDAAMAEAYRSAREQIALRFTGHRHA